MTHIVRRATLSDGRVIVVVENAGRKDKRDVPANRNVYALDSHETVLWQVSPDKTPHERDDFVHISIDGEQLTGRSFQGWKYLIDSETGRATLAGWTK